MVSFKNTLKHQHNLLNLIKVFLVNTLKKHHWHFTESRLQWFITRQFFYRDVLEFISGIFRTHSEWRATS